MYCLFIYFLIGQVARKFVRIIGSISDKDLHNEIRAIRKLCSLDVEHNLVDIFHHKIFTDEFKEDRIEIDMELCLGTLSNTICDWPFALMDHLKRSTTAQSTHDMTAQILTIIQDILRGLEFIHKHNEVHRDLKPDNGLYYSPSHLIFSFILLYSPTLEDC